MNTKKYINTWNIWWSFQIVIPIIICILLFTLNIPLDKNILLIFWILATGSTLFIFNKKGYEISPRIILLSIIVMFISILISANIYDTTVDGQWYHYDAIEAIRNGWNPLYNINFDRIGEYSFIYSEHYPKGTWIFGAFYSIIFNSIEIGKVYNIYAILLLIGMVSSYLYDHKKETSTLVKVLIILCAALNPIAISQLNSFYVDGWMGNLFIVYCIAIYLSYTKKDILNTIIASICIIMIVNTKYTGLGYVGVIGLWLLIYIIKNSKLDEYHWKKLFIPLIVTGIISLFYIGYDSYVRNTIDHKHPFYPISGQGSVDIMTSNTPESFRDDGYVEKFLKSHLSKTSSSLYTHELKSPFNIDKQEFQQMNQDTRIAGFGPMFSLGILVFIISLILILKENLLKEVMLLIIPLLLTVAINPENWWARYIPQLWVIPIIVFMIAMRKTNTKVSRLIGFVGICILIINATLSFKYLQQNQYLSSKAQKDTIRQLQEYDTVYIELQNPAMVSIEHKMNLLDVNTEQVSKLDEEKYQIIQVPYTFSVKVGIPK